MNYYELLKAEDIKKDFIDYVNKIKIKHLGYDINCNNSLSAMQTYLIFNFVSEKTYIFIDVGFSGKNEIDIACSDFNKEDDIKKDIEIYLKYAYRKNIIDSI